MHVVICTFVTHVTDLVSTIVYIVLQTLALAIDSPWMANYQHFVVHHRMQLQSCLKARHIKVQK